LLDKRDAGEESCRLTSATRIPQSAKSNSVMTSKCRAIALRNSKESSIYARQSRIFLFFCASYKANNADEEMHFLAEPESAV
jgi:hypothetical protein